MDKEDLITLGRMYSVTALPCLAVLAIILGIVFGFSMLSTLILFVCFNLAVFLGLGIVWVGGILFYRREH